MTDDEIVRLASEAAADLGDAEPSDIEWTYSTQAEVARVASGDDLSPSPHATKPALVIQARGSFTVQGEPAPPPDEAGNTAPPPTGRAFLLTVDATTGEFYGLSVKPEPVDLAELGTVERAAA